MAKKRSQGKATATLDLMDVFVLRRINGDPATDEFCQAEFVWEQGDVYNDDANDRPYEHNCGETCSDKSPVFKIVFTMPLGVVNAPCSHTANSSFSLEDIRDGSVAWMWPATRDLLTDEERKSAPKKVMDGDTLRTFVQFVDIYGGDIYVLANSVSADSFYRVEDALDQALCKWSAEPDRYGAGDDAKLGTKTERAEAIRKSRLR